MELSDSQKQAVKDWVEAGCGLQDIQEKLSEEFGLAMTYMDVRFLVIDLGLDLQDKQSSVVREKENDSQPSEESADDGVDSDEAGQVPPSSELTGVSIEVDRVVKPGSLVSGSVTFADGESAMWSLDQFGRLALDPGTPGYRPSSQDIEAFQEEIKKALAKKGF